ncbi:phasin family protein [Herbaspirillum sp. WKF16]|uniref:phasin family protein n=1 Tax=Herbaspirillum sp. WKF16 TaxID=3028312 RepID=UPI0023A91F5B|nr:phasin family protein [Herbaspirillum sp. WKF16]WDZ95212.1 phasin family protein [Herbaspirillum sp. WKF16]
MPHLDHEDIIALYRTYAKHQIEAGLEFGAGALECSGQLSALGAAAFRKGLANSMETVQQCMGAASPAEFIGLVSAQAPKRTEESMALARQAAEIVGALGAELTRATQQHAIDLNKQVTQSLNGLAGSRGAPIPAMDFAWQNSLGDFPSIVTQMVETGRKMMHAWNASVGSDIQAAPPMSGNQKDKERPAARHARA